MKAKVEKLPKESESSFRLFQRNECQFPFHWHYHPEFELTLIVKGSGRRFVGDSIRNYEAGDLALLGPNLSHTWCSASPGLTKGDHSAIVIHFADSFLGDIFFRLPEMKRVGKMLQRSARGLHFSGQSRSLAEKSIVEMERQAPRARLIQLLKILAQLSSTKGVEELSGPSYVPDLERGQHRQIDLVCTFINDKYVESISQVDVATLIEMSPSQFSRFFKESTGRTFVQYVNELRVAHACRLLTDTRLSVTEICFQSGFSNVSNFNRRFLNLKEMSPLKFRRCYSGDNT